MPEGAPSHRYDGPACGMGAHLAAGGHEIKGLNGAIRVASPDRKAVAENYCGAGLTAEQNMNIIVPQAAMDQILGCVVLLWIKKGISL